MEQSATGLHAAPRLDETLGTTARPIVDEDDDNLGDVADAQNPGRYFGAMGVATGVLPAHFKRVETLTPEDIVIAAEQLIATETFIDDYLVCNDVGPADDTVRACHDPGFTSHLPQRGVSRLANNVVLPDVIRRWLMDPPDISISISDSLITTRVVPYHDGYIGGAHVNSGQ
jgi:hypothetical protein